MEFNLIRRAHAYHLAEHAVGIVVTPSGLVELCQQVSLAYALPFAYSLAAYGLLKWLYALLITFLVKQM